MLEIKSKLAQNQLDLALRLYFKFPTYFDAILLQVLQYNITSYKLNTKDTKPVGMYLNAT